MIRRAATILVALVAFGTACSSAKAASHDGTGAPRTTVGATAAPTTTTTPPVTAAPTTTTGAPPPAPTTTTTTAPPAPPALRRGSSGPAVLALQQRLVGLGYWIDNVNGVFGDATQQAVYAYQKVAGVGADGSVGPVTEAALTRGLRPTPRSHSGHVVEIDLAHDLLMIVNGGRVDTVLNTSTGGGYQYRSGSGFATATTPRGYFHVYRQIDGLRVSALGELWRPKYFTGGIAVHGDSSVPSSPVSHGCARVSNEAINWIWASGLMPLGTPVWVY